MLPFDVRRAAVLYSFLCCVVCVSSTCPFPGLPKNGIGRIANRSIGESEVRPLLEGERIVFLCYGPWKLRKGVQHSIKCSGGGSLDVPLCDKIVDTSTWQYFDGNSTTGAHRENWCDATVSAVRMRPGNGSFPAPDLREIEIGLCEESQDSAFVVVNGWYTCTQIVNYESAQTFRCRILADVAIESIAIHSSRLRLKKVTILARSDDYCGIPQIPVDGSVTLINDHLAQYACRNGFQLSGNTSSTCDPATGQWSSVPSCVESNSGFELWFLMAVPAVGIVAGVAWFVGYLHHRRGPPMDPASWERYGDPAIRSYAETVMDYRPRFQQ